MIDKSFIDRIVGLGQDADGKLVHVNGIDYSTQQLFDTRKAPPEFPNVRVATLTGLVSYVRANPDDLNTVGGSVVAHITDPRHVSLWGEAERAPQLQSPSTTQTPCKAMGLMSRPLYLVAECVPPGCADNDGPWMDHSDFMLFIQQAFTDKGDMKHLKQVIGNIANEDIKSATDDGVTQRVTTRTGAVLVGDATVPNPVKLHPIMTFAEIAPPPMEFILRVRDGRGDLPMVGLFPTDAGIAQWSKDAVERIAAYLGEKLADTELGKTVPVIY
jgi:hypothetical protein